VGRVNIGLNEAHVWMAFTNECKPPPGKCEALLSPDEKIRSARFKFARDRQRYVFGKGLLRELLSLYLAVPAEKIQFADGARGKPRLAKTREQLQDIRFNVSDAGDGFACAIAIGREVGVDIESVDEVKDREKIAEQFFTPGEATAISKLRPASRNLGFLRCWTRKEAYAKAKGEGLYLNLRGFEVFESLEKEPTLRVEGDPIETSRWTLVDLEMPDGYVGALAVEGQDVRVECRGWTDSRLPGL